LATLEEHPHESAIHSDSKEDPVRLFHENDLDHINPIQKDFSHQEPDQAKEEESMENRDQIE
jgi:hypothetical protein